MQGDLFRSRQNKVRRTGVYFFLLKTHSPCLGVMGLMHTFAHVNGLRIKNVPSRQKTELGMFEKEFTFDRFVRLMLYGLGVAAVIWLLSYLSAILVPFFVAWFVAYLMNPVVRFFQYRLHLRFRALCVTLVIVLFFGLLTFLVTLAVPPFLNECAQLKDVAVNYIKNEGVDNLLPAQAQEYLQDYLSRFNVRQIMAKGNAMQIVRETLPQVWSLFYNTANFLLNFVTLLICLLYIFLILLDFDNLSKNWIRFVPERSRQFARTLMGDVEHEMNGYFRGQALCAVCVGLLFALGFWLIDFPLAVGLGVFIGVLYMVPYLQLLGFIPCIVLALLKASQTGQSFWCIMLLVVVVYCVVQIISDAILQPHIMGKIMSISPALIFLSLSVWGYLLGIIGLIIALPLTSLLTAYYRRYVVKETPPVPVAEEQ